jgi:hypothetical protein
MHGRRGCATSSRVLPTAHRSPITASETGSPRTVRFSPNAPGPSETPEFGLPQLSLLDRVGVDGLLTGCDQVWVAVGRAVLDGRSIAPVICGFENPGGRGLPARTP